MHKQPKVKTSPLISLDHIDVHKWNLEYGIIKNDVSSGDNCHPLSSTFHECLCLDPINQSASRTSTSETINFQLVGLNVDQVQDGHNLWVAEKKCVQF